MAQTTQTRKIFIKVDTSGSREIKDIADKLGLLTRTTKSLAGNMAFLRNAFVSYVGSLGIREITQTADAMQNLGNRIKITALESENYRDIVEKLLLLANRTNQSLEDVGVVYNRLAVSLRAAGASSDALVEITESLINSFRISGATSSETTATLVQLSQAFASGTLRGQELRSVLEQNAELARILRERFGRNLLKDAEKGLISVTEVLTLLRENQTRLNTEAAKLAPTFSQTLAKAFNVAQFAIFKLNDELRLSAKFADIVQALIDRVKILGQVALLLGATQLPILIASIKALTIASLRFVAANPLIAALAALSTLLVVTNGEIGKMIDLFRNLGAWLVQLRVWVLELGFAIDKFIAKGFFKIGAGSKDLIQSLAQDLDRIKELRNFAEDLGKPKFSDPTRRPSPLDPNFDAKKSEDEFNKLIARLEKLYGQSNKIATIRDELAGINEQYLRGALSVREYNQALANFEVDRQDRLFKEGRIDLIRYNEALTQLRLQAFNVDLARGVLTLEEFNNKIEALQIEQLNRDLDTGRITLVKYNQELVSISRKFEPGGALVAGTQNYLDSIGTISSNVADGIRNTFSTLEDSLVEFTRRGRFNFAQFTQAILDDLTRIILRAAIVRPLAEGILSSLAPGSTAAGTSTTSGGFAGGFSGSATLNAMGNVYDKGLKKFAKGGIVNSPTMFGYRGGNGLMGEAGPEAILPLKRGKGGDLGVAAAVTPVVVNVINQTGSEVQQQETTGPNGERLLDIIITGKVREGLANGRFDRQLQQSFGLSRKGF